MNDPITITNPTIALAGAPEAPANRLTVTYTVTARPAIEAEPTVLTFVATAPTASIAGTLFNDSDGDGMRDASEEPTLPRTVTLDSADGTVKAETISTAGGQYVLAGLPAGTFDVDRVFPAGYERSTPRLRITLTEGQQYTGADIGTRAIKGKPPVIDVELTPDTPTQKPDLGWPLGFGVCVDYDAVPAMAATLVALGVTHVRSFCPPLTATGIPGMDHLDHIRRARKIAPGLKWVCLHGLPEQVDGVSGEILRYAMPVNEVARERWHAAQAKLLVDNGISVFELNNELNLKRYLYFNQAESQVDPRVVKYALREVQLAHAARKAAGGTYLIVSPTIGYTDGPQVHKGYHAAFKDAGVYEYCDVAGVHCYTRKGAYEFEDYVGNLRRLVGPSKLIYGTEWGAQYQAIADGPLNLAAYAAVARKYSAVMFLYRAAPGRKKRSSDPVSLLNADLTVNVPIAKALGLNV